MKKLTIWFCILFSLPGIASELYETHTDQYINLDFTSNSILGDVLQHQTNICTVRSGPTGSQTSVFFRGTNSNHTLVTINGSAITDHSTSNGATDFGLINTNFADGLHIVHGPMSTLYGANAVAGVVDLKTNMTTKNQLDTTVGSNNQRKMSFKKLWENWSIGVSVDQSDGISTYPQGTEKDGYNIQSFNVGYADEGHELLAVRTNQTSDLDASGADDTDYTSDSQFTFLQYKNTQIDNVDIIVDTTLWDREYVNGTEVDTYDSQTYHGKVVHNYNTDIINNKAGVDVNQYSAEFNNMGSYTSSVDKTADEYGVYNNLDYSIGDMVLSGGVRYDDNSMHGSHSTYRVGSSYSVSNNLSVFGSVATGYKNPTMYEMFGADNFGYSGNANLNPETSFNKEIGVSYSKKMTSFSATVYDTDIKDMITYSGSTYINNTTNTSTMEGAEATLKFKLGDFMFTNRYAHIHAVNGTGGWLLRRPHDTFHSMVKYSKGKFYVMPMLTHYGKHADLHPTTYATVHVKERTTVDLKAGYGNLALEIANVFDDDYERPLGYNQGGQQLKLTYSWKF